MSLAEKLVEELNCETVFTIHLGSLEIPILESVVVTWIVMAILILLAAFLTTGLRTQNISKRQAFAEFVYEKLMKLPVTIGDLSAVVTGLVLAMCLYSTAPWWIPVVGGVFAILVVKLIFGGIGQNIMNPAENCRSYSIRRSTASCESSRLRFSAGSVSL